MKWEMISLFAVFLILSLVIFGVWYLILLSKDVDWKYSEMRKMHEYNLKIEVDQIILKERENRINEMIKQSETRMMNEINDVRSCALYNILGEGDEIIPETIE